MVCLCLTFQYVCVEGIWYCFLGGFGTSGGAVLFFTGLVKRKMFFFFAWEKPWKLIMWGLAGEGLLTKKKEISSISEEWWVKSLTEVF